MSINAGGISDHYLLPNFVSAQLQIFQNCWGNYTSTKLIFKKKTIAYRFLLNSICDIQPFWPHAVQLELNIKQTHPPPLFFFIISLYTSFDESHKHTLGKIAFKKPLTHFSYRRRRWRKNSFYTTKKYPITHYGRTVVSVFLALVGLISSLTRRF